MCCFKSYTYLLKQIVLLILIALTTGHPPGHLEPLGSHIEPQTDIHVVDRFLPSLKFYNDHVEPSRPVLMKNVLKNGDIPAYQKWTDEYLREKYGEEVVEFEMGKKENRRGSSKDFKLSKFLDNYKDMDIYMVHDLPHSMGDDFHVPVTLHCGGFQRHIHSVVLWFSSGSTKSVLHTDEMDNINCLLDGKKDLIMIDKRYKHLVEADGWNENGSYSDIDVDSVDMYKFPNIQQTPWYQVHLKKGDCVFIPYRWYHQVYSHQGRNFAANIWFHNLRWFNLTDCKRSDVSNMSIPLSEFYKPTEIDEMRYALVKLFEDHKVITKDNFKEKFMEMDDLDQIFEEIDRNKNAELSFEEIFGFENNDAILDLLKHSSEYEDDMKDDENEDYSMEDDEDADTDDHISDVNSESKEKTIKEEEHDDKTNTESTKKHEEL